MLKAEYRTRGPVPQDLIEAVEFEAGPPGPGQALVRVLAAPINPSDVLTITGEYGRLPPLPAVGGNEGLGEVLAVGQGVEGLKPGQRVLLPVGLGSWVSHMLADAAQFIPLPPQGDARQLAMLAINPPTALIMLNEFVQLQPGDWVIQNAANSAVGAYLNQLAAIRGLQILNVVRREAAVEDVKRDGGEFVLVDGDDLHRRATALTNKADIKLAIDAVGGQATGRLARCLPVGGTLINYGMVSGEACVVSPAAFIFRDLTVKGFWLALWFRRTPRERQQAIYAELTGYIAAGKLRARVQAEYGLRQIKQAVAHAAAGERDGKILIVPES